MKTQSNASGGKVSHLESWLPLQPARIQTLFMLHCFGLLIQQP